MVSLHIPEVDATRGLINAERIRLMPEGAVILNFARAGIVDAAAAVAAIDSGKLRAYVCDFPSNVLKGHPRVIALPHLGASTVEAEENCAVMVADQVREFLENGNIVNAVNFPEVQIPRVDGYRIAIANSNVPNMVGQISTAMAKAGLNIVDMINRSRDEVAYTMADVDREIPQEVLNAISAIDGVLSVRVLK
jgi:D-3-phosphoglycerate dehydrogenase